MVSEEGLAFMVKSGLVPLRVALELRRDTARRTRMEMAITGVDRMVMFFDIGFSAPYSRGMRINHSFVRVKKEVVQNAPPITGITLAIFVKSVIARSETECLTCLSSASHVFGSTL